MTSQVWIPYCGAAPVPAELLSRWNFDPILLLAFAASIYAFFKRGQGASKTQKRCFTAATVLLAILFISPFCALTSALFSARVIHHVVLGTVIAPLLVASVPRSSIPFRTGLIALTGVQAIIFWLWHAPHIYAWALSSDLAYWLMQTSLLLSACAFWAAVRHASPPASVAALLATMVQMGLLGALITFAPNALYRPHLISTLAWGFSPLDDQQLAGLIMWAPAAGLYLGAALVLLGRWLAQESRRIPAA